VSESIECVPCIAVSNTSTAVIAADDGREGDAIGGKSGVRGRPLAIGEGGLDDEPDARRPPPPNADSGNDDDVAAAVAVAATDASASAMASARNTFTATRRPDGNRTLNTYYQNNQSNETLENNNLYLSKRSFANGNGIICFD
jgi:hypothetical protein